MYMCVYVCVCVCVCMCVYVCVYVCVYMCVRVRLYIHPLNLPQFQINIGHNQPSMSP